MNKLKLTAILLAGAMLLTQGSSCNSHNNPGDPRLPEYNKELPNVPPDPVQPPEDGRTLTVVITTNVEDAYAPYRITGTATDTSPNPVPGAEIYELVTGGPYTKILTYPAGHRIAIDVTVTPARPGSPNGYLIIKDGPRNKEVKKSERGTVIFIKGFTTKR